MGCSNSTSGLPVRSKPQARGAVDAAAPTLLAKAKPAEKPVKLTEKEIAILKLQEEAVGAADYMEPSGYLEKLFSIGAIRMLKASWIVARAKSGVPMARRQDLPEEAFWPVDQLLEKWKRSGSSIGEDYIFHCNDGMDSLKLFMVGISYAWLSGEHPDPDCFHLQRIARVLQGLMDKRIEEGELLFNGDELHWHKKNYGADAYIRNQADMAVFWDYPSIPQGPRSDLEKKLFKLGLSGMQLVYGHDLICVCKMKYMPESPHDLDEEGHFTVTDKKGEEKVLCWPYEGKGWCFTEDAVSNARVRVAFSRLEFKEEDIEWSLASPDRCVCNGAALCPEAFKRYLETKVFSNGSDREAVFNMYLKTFEQCLKYTTEQKITFWMPRNPQMMDDFCQALKKFENLKKFHMVSCFIGTGVPGGDNSGFKYLLHHLKRLPNLEELSFSDCKINYHSIDCFQGLCFPNLKVLGFTTGRQYAHESLRNVINDLAGAILGDIMKQTFPSLKFLKIDGVSNEVMCLIAGSTIPAAPAHGCPAVSRSNDADFKSKGQDEGNDCDEEPVFAGIFGDN